MKNNFKEWIIAAGIRAIKTMCQTAIGIMGTSVVLTDVQWQTVISASFLAGVMSILTSVNGLPEVSDGGVDEVDLIMDSDELKEVSE